MVEQMVGEIVEEIRCVWSKETIMDHVYGFLQFRIGFIVLSGFVAERHNGRKGGGGEEEERKREGREGGEGERERVKSLSYTVHILISTVCTSDKTHSPFALELTNFLHYHSKDENVIRSHFLPHFHIGSIQGPDGQRSISLSER